MDKNGIREYQKSIKLIKQEIDLMKYNPNSSFLETSKLRDQDQIVEDKENDVSYLNKTESSCKRNQRINQKEKDKQSQSQKYDHSIMSLESKMRSMKENLIDQKKQEIMQVQKDMECMMNKMREIEKAENVQLSERVSKIKQQFDENQLTAKNEYEQKIQKYKDHMQKDIKKEEERTHNSIQQQFQNLQSSFKLDTSSPFSSSKQYQFNKQSYSQKEEEEDGDDIYYAPSYAHKMVSHVQIKPQIPFASSSINHTQEDVYQKSATLKSEMSGKSTTLKSEIFTSNKREHQRQIFNEAKQNKQQNHNRSNSSSASRSNSEDSLNSREDRMYRKSNNKQSLSANHPIHKLIESNYKMNNKEIFSLIKKYKSINQSYEQGATYTQQQLNECRQHPINKQDQFEKNFAISRKLSYQDEQSASQTPNSNSNYNTQFQFATQQSHPSTTANNSMNASYSNSLIDNFHFASNNNNNNNNNPYAKRKSSTSVHSSSLSNQIKQAKNNDLYSVSSVRDAITQFKPPLNSRKSSIAQLSNITTSRTLNTVAQQQQQQQQQQQINGKFYLSNSLPKRSSNSATLATKRQIQNQMIETSHDLSDDSF